MKHIFEIDRKKLFGFIKYKGLTYEQVSKACKMNKSILSHFFSGRRSMSVDSFARVCFVLNLKIEDFLKKNQKIKKIFDKR